MTKTYPIFSVLIFALTSVVSSADQLRGSNRKLQQSGSPAPACNSLVTVAVFRSDVPTELYVDYGSGAVGAYGDGAYRDGQNWSFEWILDKVPCLATLGHANVGDECYLIHNVNDHQRLAMDNEFGQMNSVPYSSEVKPTHFWKIVRDGGGNRITLSNADHGRVIIPSTSGSGRQIQYGQAGYPLDNRFWMLKETFYCAV